MVVSTFSVLNKDGRERFFEKSFLLTNVKPNILLEMPFLTISNSDVDFQAQNLQWRSYITRDVLPTTRQVDLIEKKEFVAAVFDLEYKAFVVYVAAFSINSGDEVYPLKRVQITYLKANKAFTKVPSKYTDFANIFSSKLAVELIEYIGINNHTIK